MSELWVIETRTRSVGWTYTRKMRAMRSMLLPYVQKAVADAGSWRWPGRGRWFRLRQA